MDMIMRRLGRLMSFLGCVLSLEVNLRWRRPLWVTFRRRALRQKGKSLIGSSEPRVPDGSTSATSEM